MGKKKAGFILDDSELAKFVVGGHTLPDLEAEQALLKPGLARTDLTPMQARRFNRLYLRSENSILTFRFIAAGSGKDEAAFQAAAEKLYAFRVANLAELGPDEGHRWTSPRSGERALWERTAHKPLPTGKRAK